MSEITPKEYNNILTKGLQSALPSTQIEDGKLRYTVDTGNVYLDIAETDSTPVRIKISDIIMGMTEEEISEIIAPLPKLYLAADTCRLYVYHPTKGWLDMSGSKLSTTKQPDVNQSIWFSESDEDQPSYDTSFTYNSYTQTLNTSNIATTDVTASNVNTVVVNSEEVLIDGMKITTNTDEEGNKVSEFRFIEKSESSEGEETT